MPPEIIETTETITLLGDRLLILPDSWEEKTKGGVLKPDTSRGRVQRGTVKYIGGECRYLKSGSRVIYPRWAYADVLLNGVNYYLFREPDIHGILAGEDSPIGTP